jgi:hypothetical protein
VTDGRERVDQRPLSAPFALVTEEERSRFGTGVEDAYPLAALQAEWFSTANWTKQVPFIMTSSAFI